MMLLPTKHNKSLPRSSAGLTLVEIMVAITISLILLAGIIQIFASNKATYRTTEAISRLQENGRFAVNILSQKIRMAGYSGCSTGEFGSVNSKLQNSTNNQYNFQTAIEGYEANNTGLNVTYNITATYPAPSASSADWTATGGGSAASLPADLVGLVIPGTDVIVVRAAGDNPVKVMSNTDPANLRVSITSNEPGACADGTDRISDICEGDILMVTDCSKSQVFQTGNIQISSGAPCTAGDPCLLLTHPNAGTPGNAPPSAWKPGTDPNDAFGPGSEIYKMIGTVFYIGQGTNGSPALFSKDNDAATGLELIEDVENMQVLYGEDTSVATPVTTAALPSVATRYVTAAQIGDWDRVVSARISLLMRTNEQVRVDNDTKADYMLTGHTAATSTRINPVDDKRIRRVYTATIKLRNRGLR